MHIPDEIVEKDLTLDELGAYVRLLHYCQKGGYSSGDTYHGGYDDLKTDLLMDRVGRRTQLMEALQELHSRGLIRCERDTEGSTKGTWHITIVEEKKVGSE